MCKQRSQFSRRTLRAASAPPRDPSLSHTYLHLLLLLLPSPAPFYLLLEAFLPFASTFSLCYSALSPLTALNRRQRASLSRPGDYSKPLSREAERRACAACTGGLRHCESVLEKRLCARLRGRTRLGRVFGSSK